MMHSKDENAYCNGFLEKWSTQQSQLRSILCTEYMEVNFKTEYDEDIENILVLIKLFPAKQVGRNVIASDSKFKSTVNSLIHFAPVITDYFHHQLNIITINYYNISQENSAPLAMSTKGYPHIVVSGDLKTNLRLFYIRVEDLIFPVRTL